MVVAPSESDSLSIPKFLKTEELAMSAKPAAAEKCFVKSSPSITRFRPPRVYSQNPLSQSRLIIPKRHFSPSPVRRSKKSKNSSYERVVFLKLFFEEV